MKARPCMASRRCHRIVKFLRTLLLIGSSCGLFSAIKAAPGEDPLASWRTGVQIHAVAPEAGHHTIHAYFNTCPESPDGKYVLYYTSSTPEGEKGDLRMLERASGKETLIAASITTEWRKRLSFQTGQFPRRQGCL